MTRRAIHHAGDDGQQADDDDAEHRQGSDHELSQVHADQTARSRRYGHRPAVHHRVRPEVHSSHPDRHGPVTDTSFSAELWSAGADTYARILDHPFITGLTDGSLDRDAFRYFLIQDSHYLRSYSRALALIAGRSSTEEDVMMFARHATDAITAERELHAGLLDGLGLTVEDVDATGPSPTTTAYMSYLTAICATGSYAEAIASVLPCYWIYRDVGRTLISRGSPDPLYEKWIAAYGSPEFDATVEAVLAVTDRVGADLGSDEHARCRRHFAVTARYEWMFWDAAHTRLEWPIAIP